MNFVAVYALVLISFYTGLLSKEMLNCAYLYAILSSNWTYITA